jgi:hypothetical protein
VIHFEISERVKSLSRQNIGLEDSPVTSFLERKMGVEYRDITGQLQLCLSKMTTPRDIWVRFGKLHYGWTSAGT